MAALLKFKTKPFNLTLTEYTLPAWDSSLSLIKGTRLVFI